MVFLSDSGGVQEPGGFWKIQNEKIYLIIEEGKNLSVFKILTQMEPNKLIMKPPTPIVVRSEFVYPEKTPNIDLIMILEPETEFYKN